MICVPHFAEDLSDPQAAEAAPKTEAACQELATAIGTDERWLLAEIETATAGRWPRPPATGPRRTILKNLLREIAKPQASASA